MTLILPRFYQAGFLVVFWFWAGSAAYGADYYNNLAKTFSVQPGDKLEVRADTGSLTINPTSDTAVRIQVKCKVRTSTQDKANTAFANHEVSFSQEGNQVTVIGKEKRAGAGFFNFNRPNLQVSYDILVPRKFDIQVKTAGGDIRVGDLDGQAVAHTSSGAIRMKAITGRVEAADAGGDIHLEAGGSDVVLQTSSGSIWLKSAQGNVQAKNAGGDITLDAVAGNVEAATSSGAIKLGGVGKDVDARNSGGDILMSEVGGKVDARTSSGSIRLKRVKGPAALKNSGGDITVDHAGDDLRAETSSGSIKTVQVTGQLLAMDSGGDVIAEEVGGKADIRTSSGSIRLGQVQGKVTAKNSGGDISLHSAFDSVQATTSSGTIDVRIAAQPKGPSRLEVAGGDIKLAVVAGIAASVDARTTGGRVITELPVTATSPGEPKEGTLAGKLNGGGVALVLRASSGNIVLTN